MTQPERQLPQRSDDRNSESDRVIYRVEDLMRGRREIWIEHAGEMYRLRVTAAGKLYLTK